MSPSLILSCSTDFTELVLAEVARVAPEARSAALGPGTFAVSGITFNELSSRWRAQPPIFVRHVAPVDFTLELTGAESDVELLVEAVSERLAPSISTGQRFSVQTRFLDPAGSYKAFDVNSRVSARLAEQTGAALDVKRPTQIISITIHHARAHVGLSSAADNLSSWSGGKHRFAQEPEQLSRAEFKLLEALETFGLSFEPEGVVLDLGAAPGGWTRIARKHDQRVVAVDPARLHTSLHSDALVQRMPMTAERYLASDKTTRFDAILNDIRQEPLESVGLMQQCAARLKPAGFALMTLKLRHARRARVLEQALHGLQQSYRVVRARQLFHNRSEVTVLLREPGASRPSGANASRAADVE